MAVLSDEYVAEQKEYSLLLFLKTGDVEHLADIAFFDSLLEGG